MLHFFLLLDGLILCWIVIGKTLCGAREGTFWKGDVASRHINPGSEPEKAAWPCMLQEEVLLKEMPADDRLAGT